MPLHGDRLGIAEAAGSRSGHAQLFAQIVRADVVFGKPDQQTVVAVLGCLLGSPLLVKRVFLMGAPIRCVVKVNLSSISVIVKPFWNKYNKDYELCNYSSVLDL